MKFSKLIAASALALAGVSGTAMAQEATAEAEASAPAIAAGDTVYDAAGDVVGTIDSAQDGNVSLNTGANTAVLPATAFAKGEKGWLFGMTKLELDAAVEKAEAEKAAKLAAALVAGAELKSYDGVLIGTIASIGEDGSVEIARENGNIALTKDQLTTDGAGGLMALFTAQQLQEALGG